MRNATVSTDDPFEASIRGRRAHGGRRHALPIHSPFTCFACAQLCLTALWSVATLLNEALSAGFVDAASTAIPAHSEAKATPSLESCSVSPALSGGLSAGPGGIASR